MAYGIENKKHLGGYIVGVGSSGDPNSYATEVWDWMIKSGVRSVIDIGCGEGHSTKYFIDRGIECRGVEGGEKAYNNSQVKEHLVLHDYTESEYIPEKDFDAVWCCEFVEHVEEKFINNFINTFTKASKIFLTHALPGQLGYHHVNCKSSEYWIDKIESHGYKYNADLSLYLRSITNKIHVKNTLLVFERIP